MARKRLRLEKRQRIIGIRHLLAAALVITIVIAAGQALAHGSSGLAQAEEGPANVVDLMDVKPTIDEIIEKNSKVVLFWEQKNCAGCKVLRPYVVKAASEYPDTLFVKVHIDEIYYKDLDYGLRILQEYGVRGTPTLIVYVNGVETGRQVGLFPTLDGDQYKALLEFLDKSLSTPVNTTSQDNEDPQKDEATKSTLADPAKALALGLIAAFAPCSVPMIAAFTAREAGKGGNVKRGLTVFVIVASATLLLGFLLTLLYLASFMSRTFNPYAFTVTFAGAFILSWGVVNMMGREPLAGGSSKHSILFPLMGLQCSIPFLVLAITTARANPLNVLLTGAAFAIGYAAPYILAAYGIGKISSKIVKASSSPLFLRLQGLVLVAAGLYLIYEMLEVGIVNLE